MSVPPKACGWNGVFLFFGQGYLSPDACLLEAQSQLSFTRPPQECLFCPHLVSMEQIKYNNRLDTLKLYVSGNKEKATQVWGLSLFPHRIPRPALTGLLSRATRDNKAGIENKIEKRQELEVNKIFVKMLKKWIKERKTQVFPSSSSDLSPYLTGH